MQKYTVFLYIVYIDHRWDFRLTVFVHLDNRPLKNGKKSAKFSLKTNGFYIKAVEKTQFLWYRKCIKIK